MISIIILIGLILLFILFKIADAQQKRHEKKNIMQAIIREKTIKIIEDYINDFLALNPPLEIILVFLSNRRQELCLEKILYILEDNPEIIGYKIEGLVKGIFLLENRIKQSKEA